jgi:stalled ribosome rescue protein Dom34
LDDVEFYARVAGVLQESEAIVVAGPGLAKSSFADYLERRFSAVARRVVGIETLDHPSDAQLREYADGYFKRLQNLGAL